jgi:hypothetical protein
MYNPVIFIDPSGHGNGYFGDPTDDGNLDGVWYNAPITPASAYGVSLQGWSDSDVYRIEYELQIMANNYKKYCAAPVCKFMTPQDIFHSVHGSITLAKTGDLGSGMDCDSGWMTSSGGKGIGCGLGLDLNYHVNGHYLNWGLMSHEFGHEFNLAMFGLEIPPPYTASNNGYIQSVTVSVDGVHIMGYDSAINGYHRTFLGVVTRPGGNDLRPYVQNNSLTANEDFADSYMQLNMGWFSSNSYGQARFDFMQALMSMYLTAFFSE